MKIYVIVVLIFLLSISKNLFADAEVKSVLKNGKYTCTEVNSEEELAIYFIVKDGQIFGTMRDFDIKYALGEYRIFRGPGLDLSSKLASWYTTGDVTPMHYYERSWDKDLVRRKTLKIIHSEQTNVIETIYFSIVHKVGDDIIGARGSKYACKLL